MIVSDLLEQVDAMVPNAFTAKLKITWMTHVQNQLFRDYPPVEIMYSLSVIANRNTYPLPVDCVEDQIGKVVVGATEYAYVPLESIPLEGSGSSINLSTSKDYYWAVSSGQLVLYPTPTANGNGTIYYRPHPKALSADPAGLATEPMFPLDYQELLVIGCASRVAKASNQLPLAQVFDADYIRLADNADRKLTKKRQDKIIAYRSWS